MIRKPAKRTVTAKRYAKCKLWPNCSCILQGYQIPHRYISVYMKNMKRNGFIEIDCGSKPAVTS